MGYVFKYYDYIREDAEEAARKRKQEIYKKLPEIKELDDNIMKAGIEAGRLLVSGRTDRKEASMAIKKSMDKMLADRAALLLSLIHILSYNVI